MGLSFRKQITYPYSIEPLSLSPEDLIDVLHKMASYTTQDGILCSMRWHLVQHSHKPLTSDGIMWQIVGSKESDKRKQCATNGGQMHHLYTQRLFSSLSNELGFTLNSLIKQRVKYFGSLKPTSYAISATLISLLLRCFKINSRARLRR